MPTYRSHFLLLGALALYGCQGSRDHSAAAVEAQLAWVDTTDAQQLASRDLAAKRFRFFEVCGYACATPGVDRQLAAKCLPMVMVERIEGTSDAYLSEEHRRLSERARSFATQYNVKVEASLRATGLSQCH